MPTALIVQLIIQVGLPLTQQLIAKWESGSTISAAEFATLIAATQVTAKQVLTNQLTAAGIALTDPHAVALLAASN